MPMNSPRTIPIRRITISTRAGVDPDTIDDPSEVYGDGEVDDFGTVIEPCILSPTGQCQYDHHDEFENCIHCGKGDGVL